MGLEIPEPLKEIQKLISELTGVENVRNVVIKALDSGVKPADIVNAMSEGLGVVGDRYEKGEYFLSELIMAGIIAVEVTNLLKPRLERLTDKPFGKVVIGTVKGDLHDIGKNIVIAMLSSRGFNVIDLGIDVPSEKFVEAVKKEKPHILAMTCLLTAAMDEMRKVIEELGKFGLRENLKVMVGGRPLSSQFAESIGADAYGSNAVEAVKIAKALVGKGSP